MIKAFFLTIAFGFQGHPVSDVMDIWYNNKSNNAEIVFNLMYPNGCYYPSYSSVTVYENERVIYLTHFVNVRRGSCTMALVNKQSFVQLAKPSNGEYQIYDFYSLRYLGKMQVTDTLMRLADIQ